MSRPIASYMRLTACKQMMRMIGIVVVVVVVGSVVVVIVAVIMRYLQ